MSCFDSQYSTTVDCFSRVVLYHGGITLTDTPSLVSCLNVQTSFFLRFFHVEYLIHQKISTKFSVFFPPPSYHIADIDSLTNKSIGVVVVFVVIVTLIRVLSFSRNVKITFISDIWVLLWQLR